MLFPQRMIVSLKLIWMPPPVEPPFARYGDSDSLDRHVSPELFAATTRLCGRLDSPDLLPQLKPWWVMTQIGPRLLTNARICFDSGVDRQLAAAAKIESKQILTLEKLDTGFRIMDSGAHIRAGCLAGISRFEPRLSCRFPQSALRSLACREHRRAHKRA